MDILINEVIHLKTEVIGLKEIVQNKRIGEVGIRCSTANLDLLPNFPLRNLDELQSFELELKQSEDVQRQFVSTN